MLIAFAYNVLHKIPDPNDSKSQTEADFDYPETITAMVTHFKNLGHQVVEVEADEGAYLKLYENRKKIGLLFNYSLGLNGKDRYSHIPAMCEMLRIPYTGSGPLAQGTVMNKGRAKEILLANSISTLPFQLLSGADEKLRKDLHFPLIVKPVGQGCSAGITNKSVVTNKTELGQQVEFIIEGFGEEALVEPYLDGREFSVGMIGNPPTILPIIESDHSRLPKNLLPIDSLEVKWIYEVENQADNLLCPADIGDELRKKIEKLCLDSWNAVGIHDLCRIDVRCDKKDIPYVLEINSPPGLIPPEISSSYFVIQAKTAGIEYEDLLKKIIDSAVKRCNIKV